MLAIADDEFLDLFERAGIDAHATCRHRLATVRTVIGEFNCLTVFNQENFSGDCAYVMRKASMAEKLTIFSVNGNEITRPHKIKQKFLLFLAGMAGNVDQSSVIIVVDQGALAEHVVQHAENGFFIPRNDARRENHGVALIKRE